MADANEVVFEMTLSFKKHDIQSILDAANFSDGPAIQVDGMMNDKELFDKFKQLMLDTSDNFVMEIVDGSRDACANDWLMELREDD